MTLYYRDIIYEFAVGCGHIADDYVITFDDETDIMKATVYILLLIALALAQGWFRNLSCTMETPACHY